MHPDVFDVIVIGGGVVGCAVIHQLSSCGYRCLLLEQSDNLLTGASSGNSGIFHTGFDATPGTEESRCLQLSQTAIERHCVSFGVPLRRSGAIMVAWSNSEMQQLVGIEARARELGVNDVRMLGKASLIHVEPNLNPTALGGLLIPGESVVDSFLLPLTMAHHAVRSGAKIDLGCRIWSGRQLADKSWEFNTPSGTVRGQVVINAAGLRGDEVEQISHPSRFSIRPRRGQSVVYGPEAGSLIKHIILPVPSARTKGIIVYTSVHGNLVVGPTAEDVDDREDRTVSPETSRRLVAYGERVVPRLTNHKPIGSYVGIRPATETKDYHLYADTNRNWVTVGGIRSTGISACLGIAQRVQHLVQDQLHVSPSGEYRHTTGSAAWWATDKSTVVMDGVEYSITHPLSRLGLKHRSKL